MNYLPAIEAELRRAGVTAWDVIQGRHLKVRFTWNGRTHTFVTPRSPSETRGIRNCLADLRAIIGKPQRRKSERQAKQRAAPVERLPVLSGVTRADWRDVLRQRFSGTSTAATPAAAAPRADKA